MELKNMAITPDEIKEEMAEAVSSEPMKYPYGLSLSLDEDAIEKLQMMGMPKVGDMLMIEAKACVCEVSEYQRADGSGDKRIQLQITDMGIAPDKAEKSIAESLYGS